MPCVAAIQQDRIGAVRLDRLDHGRHAVHAAHAAIGFAQRDKIVIGQRISLGRAGLEVEHLDEVLADNMRRLALHIAHADIPFGFAEPDRLQMGVDICDMDNRQISERVEFQQIILRQRLLRGQFAPVAITGNAVKRRSRDRGLQELAPRNHEKCLLGRDGIPPGGKRTCQSS